MSVLGVEMRSKERNDINTAAGDASIQREAKRHAYALYPSPREEQGSGKKGVKLAVVRAALLRTLSAGAKIHNTILKATPMIENHHNTR